MARRGGLDNNASYSGLTTRKGKAEQHTSVFSTATQSTIDAGASGSKSFSEGTISRHQRDADASTISSDGIQLTQQSSIRRVASLELALPHNKKIIHPIAGKVEQDRLVDDIQSNPKLASKSPYADKHLISESSSSNSSHVIAPNHSENKSQLESSVETKPDREEMLTELLHKALKCSFLADMKNSDIVRSDLVGSASLKMGEFSKGAVKKQLKSCDEQATFETSHFSEQLCSEKMKTAESRSPETRHGSKEAAHEEQQLSKLRVTTGHVPRVSGFDLNEDLEINEVGSAKNSLDESISYHHATNVLEPIAVVAKVGVPNGLPSIPLRFGGELGWRRSVATSAFRATFPSNNSDLNKGSCGKSTDSNSTPSLIDRGFDLNIAPPSETHVVESSVELGLKVSEGLTFNHNSEGDKFHASPNSQMLSFDLNDNLLMDKDTSSALHPPGLRSQPKGHYLPTDTMNGSAKLSNVSGVRPAYWVDLSSMPGFTHVQGQPFLVAAPTLFPSADQKQTLLPLQPNIAFTPTPGPPSGYYIGTTNGLSSSIYPPNLLPHFGSQHGTSTTLPQVSGPVLSAYPGSLHLMETAQGLNPGGYTNMRPSFFLGGGVGSSENTNRFGNFPAEERMRLSQTVAVPALADKRKEPEGGWGSYQLDHRRMTTWK